MLHGQRDAGDEPPAAHRHEDGVDVGKIRHDFQCDRPLSGNDVRVIKGMNKGTPLPRQPTGRGNALGYALALEDHLAAVVAGGFLL